MEDDGIEDVNRRDKRMSTGSRLWCLMGRELPRSEIIFFSQMIIIIIVIISSIYNLTTGHKDRVLWITLLSSTVGYCLPNPSLERRRVFV